MKSPKLTGSQRFFAKLRRWLGGYDIVAPRDNNGVTREGRVTCWENRRRLYAEGDPVFHLPGGGSTYSIKTKEGFWVNVADGQIRGWTKRLPVHRVADFDRPVRRQR